MVLAGLGTLGILWLTNCNGTPDKQVKQQDTGFYTATGFAERIGVQAGGVSPQPVSIAVGPATDALPTAPVAPVRVRHDAEAARQVWGRPAEFAPPE